MFDPTLQFILLSLLVVNAATAACPTSTPYTVTAAETITSCTITDKQVVVNTGGCSACAFVYSYNTVSNLGGNLIPIEVSSVSPGGSITITHNDVKLLAAYTVHVPSTVTLSGISLTVAFNTVAYMLGESSGYFLFTMEDPDISGVSTFTISSNTVTFTGTQTTFAAVPMLQFSLKIVTASLTVYLDDNVLDISGILSPTFCASTTNLPRPTQ